MDAHYDLQRFVDAQDPILEQVYAELQTGRKQSHWMWYIFPQIRGLGHSPMAQRFAISSLEEAKAYIEHAVLGERLRQCTELVNAVNGRSAQQVFGYPDVLKFQSSMTLFALACPDAQWFQDALQKYYDGNMDAATLDRLRPLDSTS